MTFLVPKNDFIENGEMMFPLQIQYRNIDESNSVSANVWDHAEKLERSFDRITSCHVVISTPHRSSHQGTIYHVQIRVFVPGEEIFVSTESEKNGAHEDIYVAVRDAFLAMQRQLTDLTRRRKTMKRVSLPNDHGHVERVFYAEGYGFIMSVDNREIYFHENAVLNGAFSKLEIGDEVRFHEEMGENGPQVTSMSRMGHSKLVSSSL